MARQPYLDAVNERIIVFDGAFGTFVQGLDLGPDDFGGYDSGSFGSMRTWDELYSFERKHVGPGGMANGKRHQAANVLVEPISADEVHVTHDMQVLEVAQEPRLIATGRYERSVVVRTAQGWRFKARRLHVDPGFFALMGQAQAHGEAT